MSKEQDKSLIEAWILHHELILVPGLHTKEARDLIASTKLAIDRALEAAREEIGKI